MGFLMNLLGMGGYENIDVVEYRKQFNGHGDHVIVDVRTHTEFKQGHLPKSMNIPLNDIEDKADNLPKNKPVIVVCATGSRSRFAAAKIAKKGHESVYNLVGGVNAWMRAGNGVRR